MFHGLFYTTRVLLILGFGLEYSPPHFTEMAKDSALAQTGALPPAGSIISLVEQGAGLLVLAILMMFTYALFFHVPYIGFDWTATNGRVLKVFVKGPLKADDRLIRIGSITLTDFAADLRQIAFDRAQPGDVVPLLVQRGGEFLEIQWAFPGFNQNELLYRLSSQFWLAYLFWAFGEIALFFLRPKDARRRLMIAFNFVTAIWLAAGTISHWHVWESALVTRAAMWLSIPIYLHLHWNFPKPLATLPKFVWPTLYAAAILLAAAQWFQLLPDPLYAYCLSLALLGSFVLLGIHFAHPAQRPDVRIVLMAGALAVVPTIFIGVFFSALATQLPSANLFIAASALLTLPILPAGYLYATYRHQLGGMEVRANRILAGYLFFVGLGLVLIIFISLADTWLTSPGGATTIGFLAAMLAALATRVGFAPFERFVERRILQMPLPPAQLLETYAARITIGLDEQKLIRLLRDEIMPSLLVRQSALIKYSEDQPALLYTQGVESGTLNVPPPDSLANVLMDAEKLRDALSKPLPWARLVFPLSIDHELIGLWLLGRRDPDDFYSRQDIAILKSLANQTAIAITNILQADRLRALYQADVDRREVFQATLARRLHDDTLYQLRAMKDSVNAKAASLSFLQIYESLTDSIRQIITGLRPVMLNSGLYTGLIGLVAELTDRYESGPEISLDVPPSTARYDLQVELYLYRIVQQACDNALRHAQAQTIRICGRLEPEEIELAVEDDGIGFAAEPDFSVDRLIADKHFGLAGISERAELINARMEINSAIGRGTTVKIAWRPKSK